MARVLIVDDQPNIRETLAAVLERDGYTVRVAADAEAALQLLRSTPQAIDVVLSDIVLPGMTGVSLLQEIHRMLPHVQIVLMTGEPDVETAAGAVRGGAFDYLAKPVRREAVCRVIENAADKKRLLDSEAQLQEENRRHRQHLEALVAERSAQLGESERRFRLLAENAVDAVWQMTLGLRFIYISPSIESLTGHTPEEWTGTSLKDHATRIEYRKMARQAIQSARNHRTAQPARFETTLLRRDGSTVPVEIVAKLLKDGEGSPIGFQGSAHDISERVAGRMETARLHANQLRINQLSLLLGSTERVSDVCEAVYRHVVSVMDVQSVIISFYDEKTRHITAGFAMLDGERFDESKLPPIPLAAGDGGTQSQVIRTGEPLYLADYRAARKRGNKEYTIDDEGDVTEGPPPEGEEEITRSAILAPLKVRGKVIGVLQVHSCRLDAYSTLDVDLLVGLAHVAAVAIQNARLHQKMAKALEGTVGAICRAIDLRDPYTAGHQQRVTQLAIAIAKEMHLPHEEMEGLRVAAMLHDIGKISIPAETLAKPGRLSEAEFGLIRAHPITAFELLQDVEFPWPVGDLILQHHERLDGSGYPHGLTSPEILLEAKILAVSDVVEAMASHRPYRPALGIDAALNEIEQHHGELYDSSVVDACVSAFREGAFRFDA